MNNDIVNLVKALSHSTRVDILRLVSQNDGALCYNNVLEKLKLSLTTSNYHIKKLIEADLLINKRKSNKNLLALNYKLVNQLKDDFYSMLDF